MSEYKYVKIIMSNYSDRKDTRYELHTENGTEYPTIIEIEGKDIGCLHLYSSALLKPDLVEILHIRIYDQAQGQGSKLLKFLCDKADNLNITLYVMPVADKSKNSIPLYKLKEWYRKFGFKGDLTMERKPNA